MSTFALTNWDRFQHYKDRDPPWIKLYRDLLTSESWVLGTDLSRVVQVASVLLAPRYTNSIPLNFRLLKQVMSLDCKEAEFMAAIEHLERYKFLEIQHDDESRKRDASNALATCTSEKRREDQRREEKTAPAEPVAGLDLGSWERWVEYRSEIRKALKPASIPAAQKAMAAFGPDQAKVVEQSIANGWQGLFPLNTKQAFNARPVGEADRAWSDLITSDGAKRDSRVQRALEAVGGWLAIKARTPFNETKLREQFFRAYSEAA